MKKLGAIFLCLAAFAAASLGQSVPLSQSLNNIPTATTFTTADSIIIVQGGIGKKASSVLFSGVYQVFDADLAALAALTGTNTIYYRSAAGVWSAVTIGSGLSFTGGTLTSTATGAAWGSITGTLSSQTDLQAALDAKLGLTGNGSGLTGFTDAQIPATIARDAEVAAGYQPLDSDLTSIAALTTTSFGRSLLSQADATALRSTAGLIIGTNVQAFDADLSTYAGITPSANVQSLLGAVDYAAMRTQLGLVIGTNVQAFDADLSTYAGITPSANVQSFLGAATYAAMRTQLGLVVGTDVQAFDADLTSLAGATGTNTIYYRSAANTWTAVTIGTNLTFTGGTLTATGGGGAVWGAITGTLSSQTDLQTALDARQPLDADLTSIAALTTTAFGRGLLDDADATAGRSSLGLVIGTNVLAPTGSGASLTGITAGQVSFADADANFAATNVEAAIAELDDTGTGPNAADGKVAWGQLVNVPAGFADGSDDGAGGGGGTLNTVKENNIGVGGATITALDFLGADFDLTETPTNEINVVVAAALARDAEVAATYAPLASPTFTGTVTAPTFVGALTGNASTATSAATLTTPRLIGNVSFNGSADIVPQTSQIVDSTAAATFVGLVESATGNLQTKTDAGLTYNATTGMLTATGVTAPLTGNATTATTLQTSRNIGGVAFNGSAAIEPQTAQIVDSTDATSFPLMVDSATGNLQSKTDGGLLYSATTGLLTATGFSGPLTGNASTATTLQTARLIGNVSFNGSADITPQLVQTVDSTDATANIAMFDSATGDQQVKTDAGLTYNATTGMLTATGLTGPLTGNASTATTATTATTANTGDSATAFFTTGLIERARGGTNVDSSAFGNGLLGSDVSNNTIDIDTIAEFSTALGVTGTPSSTTFLRGDGQWQAPSVTFDIDGLSAVTETALDGDDAIAVSVDGVESKLLMDDWVDWFELQSFTFATLNITNATAQTFRILDSVDQSHGLTFSVSSNLVANKTFTYSGAFNFSMAVVGDTSVTFPTSGTLATTTDVDNSKGKKYITLWWPHSVSGGACIKGTNDTQITWNRAVFGGDTDQVTNNCNFFLTVPGDLDQAVSVRAMVKFTQNGASTGSVRWILQIGVVNSSGYLEGATLTNAVNLDFGGDGSGAAGDVQSVGWTTLSGWASAMVPDRAMKITLFRDGDSGSDTSTQDTTLIELKIEYDPQ